MKKKYKINKMKTSFKCRDCKYGYVDVIKFACKFGLSVTVLSKILRYKVFNTS